MDGVHGMAWHGPPIFDAICTPQKVNQYAAQGRGNNRPVYGLTSCPFGRMFRLPRRPATIVADVT
jgi:hypothetical protein